MSLNETRRRISMTASLIATLCKRENSLVEKQEWFVKGLVQIIQMFFLELVVSAKDMTPKDMFEFRNYLVFFYISVFYDVDIAKPVIALKVKWILAIHPILGNGFKDLSDIVHNKNQDADVAFKRNMHCTEAMAKNILFALNNSVESNEIRICKMLSTKKTKQMNKKLVDSFIKDCQRKAIEKRDEKNN